MMKIEISTIDTYRKTKAISGMNGRVMFKTKIDNSFLSNPSEQLSVSNSKMGGILGESNRRVESDSLSKTIGYSASRVPGPTSSPVLGRRPDQISSTVDDGGYLAGCGAGQDGTVVAGEGVDVDLGLVLADLREITDKLVNIQLGVHIFSKSTFIFKIFVKKSLLHSKKLRYVQLLYAPVPSWGKY